MPGTDVARLTKTTMVEASPCDFQGRHEGDGFGDGHTLVYVHRRFGFENVLMGIFPMGENFLTYPRQGDFAFARGDDVESQFQGAFRVSGWVRPSSDEEKIPVVCSLESPDFRDYPGKVGRHEGVGDDDHFLFRNCSP